MSSSLAMHCSTPEREPVEQGEDREIEGAGQDEELAQSKIPGEEEIVRSRPFTKNAPKAEARNTRCESRVRRYARIAMTVSARAKTETAASRTFARRTISRTAKPTTAPCKGARR